MTKKANSKKKSAPPSLTEGEQLLGWVYLAVELVVLPSLLYSLGSLFGGFSDSVTNFLYYLTNAVCCALIFRSLLKASLIRAGQSAGKLLIIALTGFLILLGANQLLDNLALALIPDFINANNAAISAMVKENPFLMTIGTVLLVPLGEECLFRGLLLLGLLKKNRYGAYALSVLGFCAIHVVGYIGDTDALTLLISFIQYIPSGLVLAFACENTNSLFTPMLIHAAVNAGSVIALR